MLDNGKAGPYDLFRQSAGLETAFHAQAVGDGQRILPGWIRHWPTAPQRGGAVALKGTEIYRFECFGPTHRSASGGTVAADQVVGGAVVVEGGLGFAFEFGDDLVGQDLA